MNDQINSEQNQTDTNVPPTKEVSSMNEANNTQQESTTAQSEKTATSNSTGMAIVAYIIFFVPLLTESKDDPFVKFHVKQALMLVITGLAVSVLGSIIPLIGWFIIGPFGSLAVFVLWIIGIINAANGKKQELPIIGKYAEKWFTF